MIIYFINFYSKEDIMNLENYKLNTSQVHNNGGTLYKYKNVLYKLYDEFPYFIDEKERNIRLLKNLKLYHNYILSKTDLIKENLMDILWNIFQIH